MKYLKLYEQFRLISESSEYNVVWTEPDEEYFMEELSELIGNTLRFSKEEFFNKNNIEKIYNVMPYTLTKIAKIINRGSVSGKEDVLEILTDLNEVDGSVTDEIKQDQKCIQEGLNFFRLGKLQNWDPSKISQT